MRLPLWARMRVLHWLVTKTVNVRPPDMVIGEGPTPYLKRWYVIRRNKWFNVYFHNFRRSDDDRALHDHPWRWNLSVILRFGYIEETPADPKNPSGPRKRTDYPEGSIIWRGSGTSPHRVMLHVKPWTDNFDHGPDEEQDCWTLFITGQNIRTWGFWCPGGRWVPWQKFTAPTAGAKSGAIGAGCGED